MCMSTLWYYVGVYFCYVYKVLVCVYAIWIQCWCMCLPYVSSVAVDVCLVDPVLVCVLYGSYFCGCFSCRASVLGSVVPMLVCTFVV